MQVARKNLDEGIVEVNKNYTDATFTTWENIHRAIIFGRIFIFFISFKYLKVTKLYIYYNLIMTLAWEIGLPLTLGSYRVNYLQQVIIVTFMADYIGSFFAPMVLVLIVHLSQIASERMLYGNDITASLVTQILGVCVIQCVHLFATHIIITWFGMIFVKAEIVRIGND